MKVFILSTLSIIISFLLSPAQVLATTTPTIVSSPSTVATDSPFDIRVSISGDPNVSYYLKARVGIGTTLNKAITNNPSNTAPDDWLGDTDSWAKFPTATTDGSGSWQGTVRAKISTGATLGNNNLLFRIRSVATGTNSDSTSQTITVTSPVSPTPTSTPTPTPTPTATSAPTAGATVNISGVPSSIDVDQQFTLSVSAANLQAGTKYYLKGAFKKSGGTNYFGQTLVAGSWAKNGAGYTEQFPITTDPSGNWSGNLTVKGDSGDSGFTGEDDYLFKVGYYQDPNVSWSNETTIRLTGSIFTPTSNSTSIPTPTAKITSALAKASAPAAHTAQISSLSLPPSLLGTSTAQATQSPTPTETETQGTGFQFNNILKVAGGIIFILSGVLAFTFIAKGKYGLRN